MPSQWLGSARCLPQQFHHHALPLNYSAVGNSLGAGHMQSDVDQAEYYRKEADKFSELARSAPPGAFRDVFQETAVRFLRMAKELERQRRSETSSG
jgi:hypothetical protein